MMHATAALTKNEVHLTSLKIYLELNYRSHLLSRFLCIGQFIENEKRGTNINATEQEEASSSLKAC